MMHEMMNLFPLESVKVSRQQHLLSNNIYYRVSILKNAFAPHDFLTLTYNCNL